MDTRSHTGAVMFLGKRVDSARLVQAEDQYSQLYGGRDSVIRHYFGENDVDQTVPGTGYEVTENALVCDKLETK